MKLQHMILTALVAGLCVIGSFIKVPGFVQSAALDSAPAFLSAFFLPPIFSGIAGFLGHMATAFTSGMPFGPLHLLIAAEMFLLVFVFAKLHQKGFRVIKWIVLWVGNAVITPLPFYFIISPAFYLGALPSLMIATTLNIVVVILVAPVLKPIIKRTFER